MVSLNRRIFRDSLTVSGIGAFTQLIGFFVPMLIAMKFGASVVTDAYYLAVAVPILFVSIIVGGSIRLAFIPVFIEEQARDPESRSEIVGGLVFLLLVLSVILMIILAALVKLNVFDFAADPEAARLASQLTIELLPLIPLTVLFNLYTAVYQAQQRFALAELARSVVFISEVFFIVFLSGALGIRSIVAGQLVGQTLAMLMVAWLVRYTVGVSIRPRITIPSGLKRMLKLSTLAFAAFTVASLIPFMARMIAALLPEGSVTVLSMAQKLALIPSLVIGGSIGAVLTSHWSKQLAEQRRHMLKISFTRVLSGMFMLILPLATGLIILRQPLVDLLFHRGAFDETATAATVAVFAILAVQTVPTYLHTVIVRILHVEKAMKELFLITATGLAISVAGMYVLSIPLSSGVTGIAWGMVVGTSATMLITAVVVQRSFGLFDLGSFIRQGLKVLTATAIMSLVVHLVLQWVPFEEPLPNLLRLITCGIVGALVYGTLLHFFRHSELRAIGTIIAEKHLP